jgi:hypothetical protein
MKEALVQDLDLAEQDCAANLQPVKVQGRAVWLR